MARSQELLEWTKRTSTSAPSRRELAGAMLGGAAMAALSACGASEEEAPPSDIVQSLTGQDVVWVDTVLGTIISPLCNRRGDLATTGSTLPGSVVIAKGCRTPGDNGGGLFYWDPNSTAADDGGTIIQPHTTDPSCIPQPSGRWIRIFDGALDVRWFGAVGDGIADDYVALRNAILAAVARTKQHQLPLPAQSTYPAVVFPQGNYALGQSLAFVGSQSITNLRLVGLGNANLVATSSFTGGAAFKTEKPFQLSFEGLSFVGFPTGLELGTSTYNVATATVQLVRTNFFGCGTGLRYGSRSSMLNLEHCKFNENTLHIDILRCDFSYLNHCYLQKFTPANNGDAAIHVESGQLHIEGGCFTPGAVTTAENAWIRMRNALGGHCGVVAHGARAGGENGGLTFINYDALPDTTFPAEALTRVLLRDCHLEPGQGKNTDRPETVVRLWQTPNHIEITGCSWTNGKPVDWAALAAKVVHTDSNGNARLVYRVENNCDNGWPTVMPVPGNRLRHHMPAEFEGKANLLGGVRRGVAKVAAGANSVMVNLGLGTLFTAIRPMDISATPLSSLGSASSWWIEPSGDHFLIRTNVPPGGADVEFGWSVDLRRYT